MNKILETRVPDMESLDMESPKPDSSHLHHRRGNHTPAAR